MSKQIRSASICLALLVSLPLTTMAQDPDSRDPNLVLLEKVNSLQQEVQELRGQVEIQAHDLKMLHQRQQALYGDLEERIRAIIELRSQEDFTRAPRHVSQAGSSVVLEPALEQRSYTQAYEKIRAKEYAKAIDAMQQFLEDYPQGRFAVNAHYWLGELYLVHNEPNKAISEFSTVLTQYPDSAKYSDAMLKLGYAYLEAGDESQARDMLTDVIQQFPDTNIALLAQKRLEALNTPVVIEVEAESIESIESVSNDIQ